ncbi:MAG: flavodoxin [Muribaculaceae bacterium]|nr:flavodoxin [Muribaculaceae bacterium]
MMKIGIFYGSSTGTTQSVAEKIAEKLGVNKDDIHDVSKAEPSDVNKYDVLVLGTSTWGSGELQDSWYDYIAGLEVLDLKGKKIALFGCGDESMSDTFNDGVGELYDRMKDTGAEFIGSYDASVYDFSESRAVSDGVGIGLLLDEQNKPELTDSRIDGWVEKVKAEM